MFIPEAKYIGGYTSRDGTVEFYQRIRSQCKPTDVVLDLGAGRGEWFEDDSCDYRRSVRTLRGAVKEVIGVDVDDAVLNNRSTDRNLLIRKRIDLPDQSVDIVIADYVLEHIQNVPEFVSEISRVLVPGGIFCARTPHKYSYVAVLARLINKSFHKKILSISQPRRKSEDIFPTQYRLNTLTDLQKNFLGFEDHTYIFETEPSYYFGSKSIYWCLSLMHKISPKIFSANIFVFMQKPKS